MAPLKNTASRGRTKTKAALESTNSPEPDSSLAIVSTEAVETNAGTTANLSDNNHATNSADADSNGTHAKVVNRIPKMGRTLSRRRSEALGEAAVKPLTGRALLQKLKECSHMPIREQARQCGYLSRARGENGGHEKANLVNFYQAQVEARGHILEPKNQRDRRGREPANRVTVHKNGQIVIGAAYTQMMGLEPGDEFEIKLGYKHIRLNQLDGEVSLD